MIYLDNAATSFPKPDKVYTGMLECMKEYCANPGRSSHNMAINCELKIMECRERLATLFNIDNPLNIIFTKNGTEGINLALKGLLKKGDHIISSHIEHNSVLRPLYDLSKKEIQVSLIPINQQGYLKLDMLKSNIKKNTKAIIINHASNVIGTIQDINKIGKIAKENGLVFIVDAAQSAGIIDIDVKKDNIDILAFPGHKNLLGPQGTGGIYVSPNIDLDFYTLGGTGSNSHQFDQPIFMPDKFESGTLNTPGIVGLNEGIKFIVEQGLEEIRKKEQTLTQFLITELKNIPKIQLYGDLSPNKRVAVISFNIKNFDSSEIGYILNSNDIYVRTGYHCAPLIHTVLGTEKRGTVRVSLSYFNKEEELERFIDIIKLIVNKQV